MNLPNPPDSQTLRDKLTTFGLVKSCETLADGSIRLTTPLLYPDGSPIEIFAHSVGDFFQSARLTDGRRTFAFLGERHVQMDGHEKRAQLLLDVCQGLGVEHRQNELGVALYPESDVTDVVLRLAQACIRVSDLHYTLAFKNKTDFHQIFSAGFLSPEHPNHLENATIEGRFGRNVKLDFFVRQKTARDHLIITMTSTNRTSSHAVANDVFCRWYDLERYKNDHVFLTVLDSNSRAFHESDISRVADVSRVIRYPDEADTLRGLLALETKSAGPS